MQTSRNRRSHRNRGTRLSLRQGKRRAKGPLLPRVLGIAGVVLALAALVLLGSYLVQWQKTRQEQATQRELFRGQEAAAAAMSDPTSEPEATPAMV